MSEQSVKQNGEPEQRTFQTPKRTLTVEFYVGIFTLLGVAAFAYLAVNIAGIHFYDTGYPVVGEFDSISGLKLGAPVEIAGVKIGEVKKTRLDGTSAVVTLQIYNGVKLREDDIASIRTKGIIGDRYVKISPGSSEQTIPAGGKISDTESAIEVEEIIGKFVHKME
jgi:phospholipid/cholesterol/gamma-HCH transport system substrate-binding protein